jgi:dolichyl-phosphate-mannose-protein mannosyltransferase
MAAINFVAIAGLIAMLLCYKPVCSFIRGKEAAYGGKNGSGKKESAVSYGAADAKTGFMIFIFLFAVALLIRLIAAAIYKGNETDMNCFLLWSQSVFTDGLKKFYLSDSFHDYPPGYMYILYVVGAIRALFSWAWDSTASIVLTKMPAIIADMVTGWLIYKRDRCSSCICTVSFVSYDYSRQCGMGTD